MALRTDAEVSIHAQSSATGERISVGAAPAAIGVEGSFALRPLENCEAAKLSSRHERMLRYNYDI